MVVKPAVLTAQRYWRGALARWLVWRIRWEMRKVEEAEAYRMYREDQLSELLRAEYIARQRKIDARTQEDIRQASLRRGAVERAKMWRAHWAGGGWYFYNSLSSETAWEPPIEHIRLQECRICSERRGLTLNIDAWWQWGKGEEKDTLEGGPGVFYCAGCMGRYAQCEQILSLPLPSFEEWGWRQSYHCSTNTVAYFNSANGIYEYSPPGDRPTESVWATERRRAALEVERLRMKAAKEDEDERIRRLALSGGKDVGLEMWQNYHKKTGLQPDRGKTWEEKQGDGKGFVQKKWERGVMEGLETEPGLVQRVEFAREQRLKAKAQGFGYVKRKEDLEEEARVRERQRVKDEEEEAERAALHKEAERKELEYIRGEKHRGAVEYQKELVHVGQWAGDAMLDGSECLTSKQKYQRAKEEAHAIKAATRAKEQEDRYRKEIEWRALMKGEVRLEERLRNFYKVHDLGRLEGDRAKTVVQMAEAYEGKEADLDARLEAEYGSKLAPVPKISALAPPKKQRKASAAQGAEGLVVPRPPGHPR
jgi:hypothetical protein